MLYLSSTYTSMEPSMRHLFGYMLNTNRAIGDEYSATQYPWMLDNGAFSSTWNEDKWHRRLNELSIYLSTCIAAVVPDKLSDAQATIQKWQRYMPIVKDLGYKAAFVAQDGLTVNMTPWDELDVLFIGGSTDYKLNHAWDVIYEAKRRNIHVHVGRVNSAKRIKIFCCCDTVDGTMFSKEATLRRQQYIIEAVNQCNATKKQLEI